MPIIAFLVLKGTVLVLKLRSGRNNQQSGSEAAVALAGRG
jgi:hypothetical protein